jgi:3-oxoacyl-(acyl-carrier-protein) synthase
MKNYYINGIGSVSAQDNVENDDFFDNCKEIDQSVIEAVKPNYKDYIKPTLIRRMSKGVKIGVVASSIALQEAGIDMPEAIITGTGMGCLNDSDKFLKNIIDNDEQFLTPTSFIQSTHNTVGAQIALGLGCKTYNVTYVHGATSFESTLIDAMLMIDEGALNMLVGAVDELGSYTTSLYKLIGHVKDEKEVSTGIINSNSKGVIFSEGAQFFVLENKKTNKTYARLIDLATYNTLSEVNIEIKLRKFLKVNELDVSDLDLIILGLNGDVEYDLIYKNLQDSIFKNKPQLYYKHLSGEYNTSSSFGMWAACQIVKDQRIPEILKLNKVKATTINKILLYNQYRGENHSFTLLSSC